MRLRSADADRRLRRSARLDYEFWSADWTPWPAMRALRTRWPAVVFGRTTAMADEQDEAAELRRLEQGILVHAAAAWLGARSQLGRDVLARPGTGAPSRRVGSVALIEACLVVLRGSAERSEQAAVYRPVAADFWCVIGCEDSDTGDTGRGP